MREMREFYENYWNWRIETDYLYRNGPPVRVAVAANMISFSNKKQITVLDLGCGEGTLGKVLKEKFKDRAFIIGTDISKKALKLASEYYNEVYQLNIETDDINKLIKNKVDYVICLEVLEHLFEPKQALRKILEATSENGSTILSFPNFAFYKYRAEILKGRFPEEQHIYSDTEHLHYFTLQSFSELLSSLNLKITKIDGQFVLPSILKMFPYSIRQKIARKAPNFFGVQLVVEARRV